MIIAILASVASVVVGAALALGHGTERGWLFSPVRSFALAAVAVSVVVHLLPEALAVLGPTAFAALAGGFLLPSALARLARWVRGRGGDGHELLAIELGYLGLLVHQVGDGLALGTYGGPAHEGHGHWGILLGIVAHTIPVTAIVVLAFAATRGRGSAIVRAGGLALTMVLGVVLAGPAVAGLVEEAQPWINAAVAGLLFHVLAHDLPARPQRTAGVKALDVLAFAAGVALPLMAGSAKAHHGHGDIGGRMLELLGQLTLVTAPVLVAGFLAAALLQAFAARAAARLRRGPAAGALVAALQPAAACGVSATVHRMHLAGRGPAFLLALALAAPHAGLETLGLTIQLLGVPLAAARLGAAAAIAIGVAWLAVRLTATERAALLPHAEHEHAGGHAHDHDHDHGHDHGQGRDTPLVGARARFIDALDDQVRHHLPWLMIGWVAAAYVAVVVRGPVGGGWALQLLVVSALALPAYLPAPALVPLMAVLLGLGVSPVAVLAALLLGPFLSFAIVANLGKHVGRPAAVAAMGLVVAGCWALSAALGRGLALASPPLALDVDHPVMWVAALGLAGLAVRSLWRFGADAWLAEVGASHEHVHQHPHAQDCEDDAAAHVAPGVAPDPS